MAEDDDEQQIRQYRRAHATGGWRAVIRLADAARDARERVIVTRVERYLQRLIRDSGEENPTLTVRDVRARLYEIPQ
jgi:hypothetical protein